MRWLILAAATLAPAVVMAAPPEVDAAEVMRLGDVVQHVSGIRQDATDIFVEAMGVPEDDSDKWFISVLTMQGCAPCAKLKTDWESSPWLRALADPHDPKKSWAHYAVYNREDKSQAFRFAGLNVKSYPTIIVQPPRSGRYGEPATVVYQSGYGGDPEKLARQITAAVRQYVKTLDGGAREGSTDSVAGSDPPWTPTPKIDPIGPDGSPVFPDGRPLIPPPTPSATAAAGLWSTVAVVAATAAAVLLLMFAMPLAIGAVTRWMDERHRRRVLMDAMMVHLSRSVPAAPSTAPASAPSAGGSTAGA